MRLRSACIAALVASVCLWAVCLSAAATPQARKLKIYISADMEGVVGVVSGEQLSPTGFEYNRFREFMTSEVNAAIQAAYESGATEVVISDSHGNGQNILIEKLPKSVTLPAPSFVMPVAPVIPVAPLSERE